MSPFLSDCLPNNCTALLPKRKMDETRKDLLEYMKTLNIYHLQFNSFGATYDFTKNMDTTLLIFACDYQKWELLLPLCVAALEKRIPFIFFRSGADLASVCRTKKKSVHCASVLSTYEDRFIALTDKIRSMKVEELLPPDWNEDLFSVFSAIRKWY